MGLILTGDNRAGVFYDSEVAEKLGVNVAIILSRIIWSLEKHMTASDMAYFREGRWWMYDSIPALIAYSKLGRKQILLVLKTLREGGIIESEQLEQKSGRNHNFYSIDTDKLRSVLSKGGLVPKGDEGVSAETVSTPLVPKGDEGQCRKGTKVSAETALTSVPKGDYLSKSLTKNQTESQTKSPATVTALPLKARPRKVKALKHTPEDLEIAKLWLAYATREMSWTTPPSSWTPENFAEDLVRVREAVNLNHHGLRALLKFVENDRFWVKNAWSPAGLLKKSSNDVRKIDNILKQMKPDSLRQEQKIQSWAPVTEQEINNPFG